MATTMHTACNPLLAIHCGICMAWHVQEAGSTFRERPGQITPPVLQVSSRKRAYKLNSTDLLHAYLLRLAADMHQTAGVASAAPVQGNRHASLSLWKCLLAAAAVAVAHQVRKQLTATFRIASASTAWQSTITASKIKGTPVLAHQCSSTAQTALERQDLSRTCLAHHELEGIVVFIIISAAQHSAVKSCHDIDLHCMVARRYLVSIYRLSSCHSKLLNGYRGQGVQSFRLLLHFSSSTWVAGCGT